MLLLYNIGIRLYYIYILLGSVFSRKARLWIRGRRGLFRQISNQVSPEDKIIWFHCSSLGEFEQGRPVIEKIKMHRPDHRILLTFFSPSGYEIRKDYQGADLVCYLPLDTKRNAARFISLVRPRCVYFVKYEYWYHLISILKKRDIKTYLISGIFRSDQIFFRSYGKWFRKILKLFHHLFIQDNDSAGLLKSIGSAAEITAAYEKLEILDVAAVWTLQKHDIDKEIAYVKKVEALGKDLKPFFRRPYGRKSACFEDSPELAKETEWPTRTPWRT